MEQEFRSNNITFLSDLTLFIFPLKSKYYLVFKNCSGVISACFNIARNVPSGISPG
jgi:hypothetical protein